MTFQTWDGLFLLLMLVSGSGNCYYPPFQHWKSSGNREGLCWGPLHQKKKSYDFTQCENGCGNPQCTCILQWTSSFSKKTLRIQICPKKGINPTILLWGWDWDHQTYSREWHGSLGKNKKDTKYTEQTSCFTLMIREVHQFLTFLRTFCSDQYYGTWSSSHLPSHIPPWENKNHLQKGFCWDKLVP